jgi:hypothetical protein
MPITSAGEDQTSNPRGVARLTALAKPWAKAKLFAPISPPGISTGTLRYLQRHTLSDWSDLGVDF